MPPRLVGDEAPVHRAGTPETNRHAAGDHSRQPPRPATTNSSASCSCSRAFDRAIASRSDLLDTFYRRGVSAFELGDDAAAIRDLQYVVDREPKYDYSRARCLLARSLARSGRTGEAMTLFDRLVESSTASESLVHAAQFYAANGRAANARELVESILARRQTMPAYQKRRDRAAFSAARKLRRKLRREPGPAAAQQSVLDT